MTEEKGGDYTKRVIVIVVSFLLMTGLIVGNASAAGPNVIAGLGGKITDGDETTYTSISNYVDITVPGTRFYGYKFVYSGGKAVVEVYSDPGGLFWSTPEFPSTASKVTKEGAISNGSLAKRIRIWSTSGTINVYELEFYGEPDVTPPPVPTGLTGITGDSKVTLNWNAVAASDLKGYNVYKNGTLYTTVTTNSAVVTGLENGVSYSFTVEAVDTSNNLSGKTSVLTLTPTGPPPPDTTSPAIPVGLVAKAGNKQAVLSWTANKESDLAGYRIYQDGKLIDTVNGSTTTISGLVNGTTYVFKIAAFDISGNVSGLSNPVTVVPAEKIDVIAIPNMDSILLQIQGGSPPYKVSWGSNTAKVNSTQYTIAGLTADTNYVITIEDAAGLTWTGTVNTGSEKAYVPPSMPSPETVFQEMLDVFGTAGSIAVAIIGGAILLGIICVLAMWAWRLLKRWMLRTK